MTKTTKSVSRVIVLICSILIIGVGCDGKKATSTSESSEKSTDPEVLAQREAALLKQESERAGQINALSSRLLATYDGWEMEGALMELLPNSDSPAHFGVKLRHYGKEVTWPLGDEVITNAVFVPPASDDGGVPSVVVRQPGGQLLHVDLDSGTSMEFDQQTGLIASAAQNGCCVAYMVGDMGEQFTLKVATLGLREDGQGREVTDVQSIPLDSNSWAPAISPDGSQVVYTSVTYDGNARIYVHEVSPTATGRVLVKHPKVFPAGPQPPFWTDEGILFSAEQGGVYLLDLKGHITTKKASGDSLLIDYRSRRAMSMEGEVLDLNRSGP